jgi:hypothetical protein
MQSIIRIGMKDLLDILYVLVIAAIVYFGYRKSNKFYREYNSLPDEIKPEYLQQKGRLGFWEGGSVTKLPACLAIICYTLVVLVLLVILAYIVFFAYVWYHG